MRTLPLQMIIVELENGRRGVFIGKPLVPDDDTDDDCQVERVWFTDIHQIPEVATVDQLTAIALEQLEPQMENLQ